jgi:hypothetical protein
MTKNHEKKDYKQILRPGDYSSGRALACYMQGPWFDPQQGVGREHNTTHLETDSRGFS